MYKEKNISERFYDYELLQNKLKYNNNKKLFGKDHSDPDIKPYSVSLTYISLCI